MTQIRTNEHKEGKGTLLVWIRLKGVKSMGRFGSRLGVYVLVRSTLGD